MKLLILMCAVLGMAATAGCVRFSTYEKERTDQQITGNQGALVGKPLGAKESMGPTRTIIQWDVELPEPMDLSKLKAEKTPDRLREGEGESNLGILKRGVAISADVPEKRPIEPERPKKKWFSWGGKEDFAGRPAAEEGAAEGEIKTGGRPFRWYLPKPKTKEWEEKAKAQKATQPMASFSLYSPREEPPAEKPAKKQAAPEYYKVKKNQTLGDISMEVYGTSRKWKDIYGANKDTLKSPDKIYPGQKLLIPRD